MNNRDCKTPLSSRAGSFLMLRHLLLLLFLCLLGCDGGVADESDDRDAVRSTNTGRDTLAVKATLVDPAGTSYPLEFGPVGGIGALAEAQEETLAQPSAHLQAVQVCSVAGECDEDEPELPVQSDGAIQTFDGELLLMLISDSCLVENAPGDGNWTYADGAGGRYFSVVQPVRDALTNGATQAELDALPRPWKGNNSWYVFPARTTTSCDVNLHQQEVLLCTASRLMEIADAVAPITIPAGDYYTLHFPTQQLEDKFILRDLALDALAHLARIDFIRPSAFPQDLSFFGYARSCIGSYVDSLTSQDALNQAGINYLFRASERWLQVPQASDSNAVKAAAVAERLLYKASVLRAAGRLVREAIDKSVSDDLAGAEQARAGASDPALGLRRMWGADTTIETYKYNNLRHALRLLFGRLELPTEGDGTSLEPDYPRLWKGDPDCASTNQFDEAKAHQMLEALGESFQRRYEDRPPETPGQALALSLLTQAGILIPEDQVESPTLRSALREQLIRNAARARQVTIDDFDGAAIGATLRRITDADLKFALRRNLDAFILLTYDSDPTPFPTDEQSGIEFEDSSDPDTVYSGITSLGGRVVKGGLPRSDLNIDVMGRAGRALIASQCPTDFPNVLSVSHHPHQELVFQSTFGLGYVIKDSLQALTYGGDDKAAGVPAAQEASAGIAELTAWTGSGQILLTRDSNNDGRVRLQHYTPADFGVTTVNDMDNYIRVTTGAAWKADCLAGLRSSCPSAADLIEPLTRSVATVAGVVTVTLVGDLPSDTTVYVVLRPHDGNPGRVLATLNNDNDRDFMEVDSPYRRELANAVFGTGDVPRRGSTCGAIATTSEPKKYCDLDIDRDMFVPLANELNSDGTTLEDSWKHYIAVAEQSAARADELGRQLIETGLQRDLRREAAQEELGNICGAYVDVDSVNTDDGTVGLDNADGEIASCINPPTLDLVYLTEEPEIWKKESWSEGQIAADIRAGPVCQGSTVPAFCTGGGEITHDALGLPTYVPQTGSVSCDAIVDAAAAVTASGGVIDDTLYTTLNQLTSEQWVSQVGLLGALLGINLTVRQDQVGGQLLWEGTLNDKRVMGPIELYSPEDQVSEETEIRKIYPACLSLPTPSCEGLAGELSTIFGPLNGSDHTSIRRKLEAALWNVGALAGGIPPGTFTVPLPVYNQDGNGTFDSETEFAQAPAIFGWSRFLDNGSYFTLRIESDEHAFRGLEDSEAFGRAVDPGQPFWDVREAEIGLLGPAWRAELYSDAQTRYTEHPYLVRDTTSAAIAFDPTVRSAGGEILSRGDNIEQWLRDYFATIRGGGCAAWPTSEAEGFYPFLYQLNEGIPQDVFGVATNWPPDIPAAGGPADAVPWSHQRNICRGKKEHHVFYEDLFSPRKLYPRTRVLKDIGKPCKDVYEDNGTKEGCRYTYLLNDGCQQPPNNPARTSEHCILTQSWENGNWYRRTVAEQRLQPTVCSPEERVEFFLNRYPETSCEMTEAMVQALAFACVRSNYSAPIAPDDPPPEINDLDDLALYENWLSLLEVQLGDWINSGAFVNFPQGVLDRRNGTSAFTTALGAGRQGESLLNVASQTEGLHAAWVSMAGAVRRLATAVQTLRLEIAALDNSQRQQELLQKRQQLQLTQQIVVSSLLAADSLIGGALGNDGPPLLGALGNSAQAAAHGASVGFAIAELNVLDEQQEATEEGTDIGRQQAILSFNSEAAAVFEQLEQATIGIRTAADEILKSLNQVKSNQREGTWELAKALGADFVEVETASGSQILPQHVNTVLNRQYNILRLRYERALKQARRSAYIARLAIEERLGVRLSSMRAQVGPLEAPATWVDNLCSVQGIDYEALRAADPDNPTFNDVTSDAVINLSNQYVGDYVAQLKEFVDFYNVEFPFRQSDDAALLSLREHLLAPDTQCSAQSPNELYHSDNLSTGGQIGEGGESYFGWRGADCADDGCFRVNPGEIVMNSDTEILSPPNDTGAVSWLLLDNQAPPDPVEPPGNIPPEAALHPPPFGIVYQTVPLRAGHSYVLSWWDMARNMNGRPFSGADSETQTYPVAVYTTDWVPIALDYVKSAPSGSDGTAWSDRHQLAVFAPDDGDYHVAFAAGEPGQRNVSLAIANVQLEEPARDFLSFSRYVSNGGSRTILNSACQSVDAEGLRRAFVRKCSGGRGTDFAESCYFELNRDILIDTESLNFGFGGLVGQVGTGNYNLRHNDLVVNVVGTGVLECGPDAPASCYGSAFVEYDLEHVAFNAAVQDYDNTTRCFDFGMGAIRSGKALTAERFLTLPLSSADEGLIGQPAFHKTEFFGRPLSGIYRLRIKDSPALVWDRVEDIQLLLGYRYWSKVSRSN